MLQSAYLEQLIALQGIATLFVVILFWSLFRFLRRQAFLKWWTWAWAAYFAHLCTVAVIPLLGPGWTGSKAALILLSQMIGFLMFPFLVSGVWSLDQSYKSVRSKQIVCVVIAALAAVLCFAAAYSLRNDSSMEGAMRTAPLRLMLGVVFLYCGGMLLQRSRHIARRSSLNAALFFMLYGVTQLSYSAVGLHVLVGARLGLSAGTLRLVESLPAVSVPLDLAWTLGITIGVVFLLLEEYPLSEETLWDVGRRSSEQFAELDLLYRTAPIGLAFVDRDLKYRRVNDQLAKFHGRPAADHIGKTFAEVIPRMARECEALARRVLETGEPVLNQEERGATHAQNDEPYDWLASYFPLRVSSGEIRGVTLVVLDITSLKQAERNLIIQKAYLEQLVESAPEAVVIVDTKNIVQRVNREFTNLFGYTAAEAMHRDLDELVVPEDKQDEGKWLDREADRGVNTNLETVRRRKDGARIEVSLLVAPVRVAEGQIAVYCIYRDITSRKRAEEQLRESEERYRRLVDLSPDAIWVQRDGQIVFANSASAKLLGATSFEQLIGKRVLEITHPAYHELVTQRMTELREVEQSVPFLEEKLVRLDGKVVDVEIAATSFKFANQHAAQVIVHDLTERKRSERKLLAAETKFRLLVEQLPAITYMAGFGAKGAWTYVSPQIEAILGFTRAEWLADANLWFSRLHPDDAAQAVALEEICRATGEPYAAEYRLKARDGSYHWFTDLGTVVRDASGAVESMQGVLMDITERKQLEAQLRQSQKMEAIGQLAGGIAHDFNNILMVVRGHTDLLLNGAAKNPLENAAQIQKAADRAAALTRQLLAFSRMQVLQPEILDLNDIVAEMADMLPRLINSNIQLLIRTDPELGRVRADAGQIEQVILNLAVNARDAMPEGGRLTIRTENTTLQPGEEHRLPAAAAGRFVALIVQDSGEGMDAETQARIFEPFFTTKEKGRGTGLGLATVYGIVKQSGGYILVESAPARGSIFKIYLPYVEAKVKPASTIRTSEVAAAGRAETILLVDDETGIRELATEYLSRCGYTVLAASDGSEAKKIAEQHPGPIHLLLTDTVMPKMGGHELVKAVSAVRPETKVIYMSGYLEYGASNDLMNDSGAFYLQKPFALEALAKKVRVALGSN